MVPFVLGEPIDDLAFQKIQRHLALDFYKWDCQVGDISTLFRQPLLMDRAVWTQLTQMAEALALELAFAEEELLRRPELHALLGMPNDLRRVLGRAAQDGVTPCALRTLRFDFHYCIDGWHISEVNSDVPGGYAEASVFTQMMANGFPESEPAGDPASDWIHAISEVAGRGSHVALLSAPGFLEDLQVTAFLAEQLRQRGVNALLLHHPAQLSWASGYASTLYKRKQVSLEAIVRFYQGEWLAKSKNNCGWQMLFVGGKTSVTNPGSALLTESKRFPLTWKFLSNPLHMWQALLPECCEPQDECWLNEDGWVMKMAFSNTGDEIYIRELTSGTEWSKLCRNIAKNPESWIAQRQFQPLPFDSHIGPIYPCIGIYVINGRTAGAYVRVTSRPVTDYAAMDATLLIRN